jgi:hypothetical protein
MFLKGPQNADRVGPDRPYNRQKFNNIEPAFAAFILGDEGLGLFQPFGEVMLGQPGRLASLDHQLAKGRLVQGMDGFADTACVRSHARGKMIRSSDYPKIGLLLRISPDFGACGLDFQPRGSKVMGGFEEE